jgi:hypothetical protein
MNTLKGSRPYCIIVAHHELKPSSIADAVKRAARVPEAVWLARLCPIMLGFYRSP